MSDVNDVKSETPSDTGDKKSTSNPNEDSLVKFITPFTMSVIGL